jgi:hypothetical protein
LQDGIEPCRIIGSQSGGKDLGLPRGCRSIIAGELLDSQEQLLDPGLSTREPIV